MSKLFYWLGLFIVIIIGNTIIVAQDTMKPPVARKETKTTKINGYELKDDYGWLRSAKDPKTGKVRQEVEDYLNAENAYTTAVMKPTEAFQKNLYDEMLGRIKQDDTSVPYKNGDYCITPERTKGSSIRRFTARASRTATTNSCF